MRDSGILRPDLTLPWAVEYEIGTSFSCALDGSVGRAVAGDDHLEPIRWIVERLQVLHARGDRAFLPVCGDDYRYEWKLAGAVASRPRRRRPERPPRPGDQHEQHGIADLREHEQAR
jgi:hypothetical protein